MILDIFNKHYETVLQVKWFKSFWLAVAFTCCTFMGCEPAPQESLRVATNQWPGYEPLYLARDLGYFDKTAVKLYELPNAPTVINAFRNRAIDIAALTLDEALLLMEDNIDVRILLVMDISNGADALVARPEVTSLQALKGKRIAVENGAVGAYMLLRTLHHSKLTSADVTVVRVTADKHNEVYDAGDVDAVVTFEPMRSQLLKKGAHVLFDSSDIPNEIFDVLVVHSDVYHDRIIDMRRLVYNWFRALDYIKEKPQDAAERMAPRLQLSPDEFIDSLTRIKLPDLEQNKRCLTGKEPAILKPASILVDVMSREKLIKTSVNPALLLSVEEVNILQ